MKKLFFITLLTFLLSINITFANNTEEEICFQLLNEAVKNDSRFIKNNILKSGDLSKVLFDEQEKTTADFSTYESFNNNREPRRFYARRNNIGTLVFRSGYYPIVSHIGGFGRDSNFDFPLTPELGEGSSFGDKYELGDGKTFKEYLVYTHHLKDNGKFLSCGIVKVNPLGDNTFGTVSENNYYTNILNGENCSSGFEGEKQSSDGKDYYAMKSNVCVKDFAMKDLLKLEVISIAWDNGSNRFNEYITHPLQVKAMRNNGNNPEGLFGVMKKFRDSVRNETCLRLVHRTLPSRCGNSYNGETKDYFSFLDFLIPQVEAKLDLNYTPEQQKQVEKEMEQARGMVIYENIPYDLYEKIEQIPNENFREYLKIAMVPGFEKLIAKRKEQNIVITPFEKTFLNCNLSYKERTEIIIDFLEKVDPKTFDINNLKYTNKKFGDCIIPYPDKENLDKVIEGSFASNQLYAQKLNGTYKPEADSEEVRALLEEMNKIAIEKEKALNELSRKFNEGIINAEEFEKEKQSILDMYKKRESAIMEGKSEKNETMTQQPKEREVGEKKNQKVDKNNITKYLLPSILFILGIIVVVVAIIFRNKKK